MTATRIEKDSLGEREVPVEAYYGVQTVRALENFPISGMRAHPALITAHATLKKAAALTNRELGNLDPKIAVAVIQAADELLEGGLRDQIAVDVFQAGAGVSFNMNCNEVIANRAIELLGGRRGDYQVVHPNDHVNMAQSTNDTFPTSLRLSSLTMIRELDPVLERLEKAFAAKGREFDGIVKSGRTHLQDAVPVRLGQEFAAYAVTVGRCRGRILACRETLSEIGIGGTAVGTGINTHPEYRARMVAHLSKLTGHDLRNSPDMREAMQSQFPLADLSSALKLLALELIRIANDLRLLSSGPRTGLAEIQLPAVQPGSSIMPGKVNPVMPEVLNMVAFQVVGNDLTVALTVQTGHLELKDMLPAMIYNVLQSMEILKNTLEVFRTRCLEGITADAARCERYALDSVGIATALNRHLGYAAAAEVAKESMRSGKSIYQIVVDRKLLDSEQLRRILDPRSMTEPGIPGKT